MERTVGDTELEIDRLFTPHAAPRSIPKQLVGLTVTGQLSRQSKVGRSRHEATSTACV